MAITAWFRSWHGAPTDHKWLVIARKANVAPGIVSAVAWALLDHASQAEDRGSVKGFDVETYAVFSGFDESDIASVIAAMHDKNVIDQDDRFAAWDKRQPKREDDSTPRVRALRGGRNADGGDVTQCNADGGDVTQCNADGGDVTQCNAAKRNVTQRNARGEERRGEDSREDVDESREDKEQSRADTPLPPKGGGGAPAAVSAAVLADDYAVACRTYEDNIGLLSPIIAEKIEADLEEYPVSWFVEAVGIAVARNKPRIDYVEGILERWRTDGKWAKRNGNGYARDERERDPYKGARELK